MSDFDHILNWKLLRGSYAFPGLDGGTCINEAAIVACGFRYRPVVFVGRMPKCFSRPICRLALQLNDMATDAERQRLMLFVTRLACADKPKVERERARYINARFGRRRLFMGERSFEAGLQVLEGALAIGRQADPLGIDEVASRLAAVRKPGTSKVGRASLLHAKMKEWFGLQQTIENVE